MATASNDGSAMTAGPVQTITIGGQQYQMVPVALLPGQAAELQRITVGASLMEQLQRTISAPTLPAPATAATSPVSPGCTNSRNSLKVRDLRELTPPHTDGMSRRLSYDDDGTTGSVAAAAARPRAISEGSTNPLDLSTNESFAREIETAAAAEASRKRATRLLQNAEAAKATRSRKKDYVKRLEDRIKGFEERNKALTEELKALERN